MSTMPMPQEKTPALIERLEEVSEELTNLEQYADARTNHDDPVAELRDLIQALPDAIANDRRITCRRTAIEEMYNRDGGALEAADIADSYDEPVEWVEQVLKELIAL